MTSPLRRRKLRRTLAVALVAAAVIVVVLVVLVAAGVLVLPSNSPKPVTITSVTLHILQGEGPNGIGWFGASYVNYSAATGNDYPMTVAPGGTWGVSWSVQNFDNSSASHTIYSVVADAPFVIASTSPSMPFLVVSGLDSHTLLSITVAAPSTPGITYADVMIIVNAQTPS
jgi:hypothetical protein